LDLVKLLSTECFGRRPVDRLIEYSFAYLVLDRMGDPGRTLSCGTLHPDSRRCYWFQAGKVCPGSQQVRRKRGVREKISGGFVSSPVHINLRLRCGEKKGQNAGRVKYWEIIADNLKKAGWSLGWVAAVDSSGRTIWIADAHRDDGKRFVVRADEKLTAFAELEAAIGACITPEDCVAPEINFDKLSRIKGARQ